MSADRDDLGRLVRQLEKLQMQRNALSVRLAQQETTLRAQESEVFTRIGGGVEAFTRAGGGALCTCTFEYVDHPPHPNWTWLRILCDGRLVKL